MKLRFVLMSASAMLTTAQAAAQEIDATTEAQQEARQGSVGTGGASSSDIVVTALKGRTSLQKTPAAVTVMSSEILTRQRILDIREAQVLTPAAHFGKQNNATQVNIRGIGSTVDFYWIPEMVAMNSDGVYLPRYASAGSFLDLESVQVLPGPQGVLYGRSAGGGAIVLSSKVPSDTLEAQGNFEYGNYDAVHASGIVNVPVGEGVAFRGGVHYRRHDGYQTSGNEAGNAFAAKATLLLEPMDDLKILLRGTYFQDRGKPAVTVYLPTPENRSPWYVAPTDPVTGANTTRGFRRYRYDTQSVDISYDLGGATIQYIAARLFQKEDSLRSLVGNDQTYDADYTQYTQSLRLSSSNGAPLQWIAGLDWFRASANYDSRFGIHEFGNIFDLIRQKSYSGFGQLTYSATATLRLVAGARISRDELQLEGVGRACFFGFCSEPPVSFDKGWTNVDVKGGIEYDLTSRTMLYGNVQTGYAPGTLNTYPNATTFNKEVKPQHLLAFTAGFKSRDIAPWLTLNGEGYYYRYHDLIIQAYNAGLGQQVLYNAPKATIWGAQLTANVDPTDEDTLTLNLAYTHGRYGSFVSGPGAVDLDGLQMQFTPDLSGSVSYEHRFDLTNGGNIAARASTYFSTSYWGTFDHSANARQKAYTKSDVSLTYSAPGDKWTLGLWMKNVQGRAIASTISGVTSPPPYQTVAFLEPPRTFGLSLGVKY